MNLPNWLTLSRILLVPALVALLLEKHETAGLVVFVIATATDWLDGYLARRRNQVTTLGMLLDPLADKLLVCSAFIALAEIHPGVRAWMVVIIVSREFAVTGLRNLAQAKGVTIAASPLGKLKMVGQTLAIVLLILDLEHATEGRHAPIQLPDWTLACAPYVLWAAVGLAFLSMAQYFVRFAREAGFD